MSSPSAHDPYQALRFRDFRLLLTGNLVASVGSQMLALAVGWELYERTGSPLALGMVGLVQLLPVLFLAPITGRLADRHDRKLVVVASQVGLVAASLGLAALSLSHGPLAAIYGCLLLRGVAAAFAGPAGSALPAEVLPEEAFENSASWRTSAGQAAAIAGPALGGVIIAATHSAAPAYALSAVGGLLFVGLLLPVRRRYRASRPAPGSPDESNIASLGEGIRFLRERPILLSALTLDLFAVLLGGAATLLPVFAKDILHVGPAGLGWLEAAPPVGALGVALFLAHRPPFRRAGSALMLAVAGFGLATVVFGLSQSFWLSLAMLAALGSLDCISMVIRDTMMLTRVPDDMRGRVAAIEGVFVGSSNQLGGFESGVTAQIVGPVASVVGGGIGTVLVVMAVALVWPELRMLRTLRREGEAEQPISA